ncbi:hypothetical protein AsFPU1_2486 [Aphanothece sacrum FPU1]|uniref:Uncharacterized protein n=1 Tax=Aphanothece sacrum FPU1 TaxID=1920663 RepID=A0A401IIF7_APHSA|nr:hypothetical protein [Aphanothece sacrum]GBF81077.1 hypothetical protein AsFPU1_2486 [Aphanothece sacrum FPU1]GBF85478.1 hypothetical protein AsFPU3_2537 [Aphanothece sacrum FPU3]
MKNEPTSSNSQTDWQRLDAMSDEDIDLSDCPEITPEMFAKPTNYKLYLSPQVRESQNQ